MASDMKWLSDFLDESIPMWQDDPVIYFREVLTFEPDKWQAEAARDLAHHPKVSIKSGQGVGKTGLEAALFCGLSPAFRIRVSLRRHRLSSSSTMSCGRRYRNG